MPSTTTQTRFASIVEVKAAFVGLSGEELVKLKQVARLRSHGLPTSTWEDLLQEALYRALTGTRQWPTSVPFLAFLAQTMRSLASDERRRAQDVEMVTESDIGNAEGSANRLDDLAITSVTPELLATARSALLEIQSLFAHDPDAMEVLKGLALGALPAEIQASSGMTSVQYSTAQRRIQRTLAKRYGKE
jgi:DNA-directed RNA polymerase specialized sigma24 family protein